MFSQNWLIKNFKPDLFYKLYKKGTKSTYYGHEKNKFFQWQIDSIILSLECSVYSISQTDLWMPTEQTETI